jgi:hypothetical protein
MTCATVTSLRGFILCAAFAAIAPAQAADKLVIDMDMDADLVSLAHNIDAFLFTPTMNFSADVPGNLAGRFVAEPLKNNLSATALVKINGKLAGYATEQEYLGTDPASGKLFAESAWLITLNYPGASGFIAVKQREDAAPVFGLVQRVMQNPAGPWEDRFQVFLSTTGTHRVSMATNDLAPYLGGRFEEYNVVNPADFAKYKRFRARIQFVIYPKE